MKASVAVRAFSWRYRNCYDINGPGLKALAKAGFREFDKVLIQFSEHGDLTIMRFIADPTSSLSLSINGNRGRLEGINRQEWAFDGPHSFELIAIGKGVVHFRSITPIRTIEANKPPTRKAPTIPLQRLETKYNPFVDRLNELIVAKGISITRLALDAKLSSSLLSLITRAKRIPRKGTLNKIIKVLSLGDKDRAQLLKLRDYAELGGKDASAA